MTGSFVYLLLFLAGAVLGGVIGALVARQRASSAMQSRILELTAQNAASQATLERDRAAAAEKLAVLDTAREQLANAFKALPAEALHTNNQRSLLQRYSLCLCLVAECWFVVTRGKWICSISDCAFSSKFIENPQSE